MNSHGITLAPALAHDMVALRHGASRIGAWTVPTDGLDPPEVLDILARLYFELEADPGWGSWFITRGGMIVGGCSLTEPPKGDCCIIGYSVFPGSQGRGYATAAVSELLGLLSKRGLTSVRAETSVGNVASELVLTRSGFERSGSRFDPDDGDVITWQRAL